MRLFRLLDPGVTVRGAAWREVEITGLSADSRAIRPGMLFAALAGAKADGREFIGEAVARGPRRSSPTRRSPGRRCRCRWSWTPIRAAAWR